MSTMPERTIPTDWLTGWVVALFAIAAVVAVAVLLWPLAATALESIQSLITTLGGKS